MSQRRKSEKEGCRVGKTGDPLLPHIAWIVDDKGVLWTVEVEGETCYDARAEAQRRFGIIDREVRCHRKRR